jgi:hypothetical protein
MQFARILHVQKGAVLAERPAGAIGLNQRASEPGRREGDHLLRALDYLEAGTYAEGERDVMWAEVATRQPDASELHPTASPQDLRKRFAAIAEAE